MQKRLLLAAGAWSADRAAARVRRRLDVRAPDPPARARAANRIASLVGSTSRSTTQAADELRRLADAFERMRIRLAQLDDARREFVANASHELRTPLFSLGGFLELLDDEELDEATQAGVSQLDARAGRRA